MKSFGIFFLVIFMTLNLSNVKAQKKCRFDYDKTDEFTGEVKKGNTSPIFPATPLSHEYWYLGLNRTGNNYHIGNLLQLNGEFNVFLEKGDSLMLKLNNNEIITCYANDRTSPVTKARVDANNQPVITSVYKSNYDVSLENMEKLTKSEVIYIRMNVGDKVYERKLKMKFGKKILHNATCIMK